MAAALAPATTFVVVGAFRINAVTLAREPRVERRVPTAALSPTAVVGHSTVAAAQRQPLAVAVALQIFVVRQCAFHDLAWMLGRNVVPSRTDAGDRSIVAPVRLLTLAAEVELPTYVDKAPATLVLAELPLAASWVMVVAAL